MNWPDLSDEQKSKVIQLLFGENGFAKIKEGKDVAGQIEWSESEEEQLPQGNDSQISEDKIVVEEKEQKPYVRQ